MQNSNELAASSVMPAEADSLTAPNTARRSPDSNVLRSKPHSAPSAGLALRSSDKLAECRLPSSDTEFLSAVIAGLSQEQKAIPSRFLYDAAGSDLFEQITILPEYYPTRTELGLLRSHAPEIRSIVGACNSVVEFGSGSSTKTPLILEPLAPANYVPIDVSGEWLLASTARLSTQFPEIEVTPVVGDFTRPLAIPERLLAGRSLGFFLGSTIGNFHPPDAANLLRAFGNSLGQDPFLLIGIDLLKNPRCIEEAYNDAAGVTAAFNLNLIDRINRELGADIDPGMFEHKAVWHDFFHRIEMHLVAKRNISFSVAGSRFSMHCGETIHTENSYKYTIEEMRLLARVSGWEPQRVWTDGGLLFSISLWKRAASPAAP